jgi:hypothetical protein
MDLQDCDIATQDVLALLSDEELRAFADFRDETESDLANQRIILHWLQHPSAPDYV